MLFYTACAAVYDFGGNVVMKYLPILQELFESDTIIFLIIGLIVSILTGIWIKSRKKLIASAGIAMFIYAACEILSNMRGNYMSELLLLFVGTVAIGCFIGFLVCSLFTRGGGGIDNFGKDKNDE